MLITLSGKKRVGKDLTGDLLVDKFGYTKIALADPLRELCSEVFNIPLSTFLSDELKEKPFREPIILKATDISHIGAIVDADWGFNITREDFDKMMNFHRFHFTTPREILQIVGTEIIRGCIDDNIFLKLADRRIEELGENVVVTDVRFKVEQEWAKNKNALMVLIKRPNNLKVDAHRSENELDDESNFRTVITNDQCLGRFKNDIYDYFNEIMRKE